MAIYRTVQISFWSDTKVEEEFTPEDKYFYLYLFTNPHTNLCGCYKLGLKQASNQLGYSKDSVERLVERFQEKYGVVEYSNETNEIYVKNWNKYNWTKSSKFLSPLRKEIIEINDCIFREELSILFDQYLTEAINNASEKEKPRLENIPYIYGMDTTVTVTVNNNISNTNNNYIDIYKDIIDYLNEKAGKNYRYSTKSTQRHLHARLDEGFTLDDFKAVIDNKCNDWLENPKMQQYLRPETLFGTKFESYLNQNPIESQKSDFQQEKKKVRRE